MVRSNISPKLSIRSGWLFALTATLIFGFQPVLLKATLDLGVSADDLLVLRLTMASLIFWIVTAVTKEKVEKLPQKAFLWCCACAFSFVLAMYGYTLALNYTSASVASMIFSVFPIVTLLIMSVLGERFTLRKAARVVLGLMGVYLVIGPGGDISPTGVGFAMGACFIYACFLVIMQKQLSEYKGKTIMLYITSLTAVAFIGINLVDGVAFASITALAWFFIFLQGFVATYIAQLLLFSAVKGIGSAQVSLLFPLELLLTIFWSALLLSERLSVLQGLGGGLIVLSLVLAINTPGFVRRRLIRPRL